jgi:putative RecB family exonuclease
MIKSIWNAVSKGVFLANDGTWLCKVCQYKTYCDSWFLNGDENSVEMEN